MLFNARTQPPMHEQEESFNQRSVGHTDLNEGSVSSSRFSLKQTLRRFFKPKESNQAFKEPAVRPIDPSCSCPACLPSWAPAARSMFSFPVSVSQPALSSQDLRSYPPALRRSLSSTTDPHRRSLDENARERRRALNRSEAPGVKMISSRSLKEIRELADEMHGGGEYRDGGSSNVIPLLFVPPAPVMPTVVHGALEGEVGEGEASGCSGSFATARSSVSGATSGSGTPVSAVFTDPSARQSRSTSFASSASSQRPSHYRRDVSSLPIDGGKLLLSLQPRSPVIVEGPSSLAYPVTTCKSRILNRGVGRPISHAFQPLEVEGLEFIDNNATSDDDDSDHGELRRFMDEKLKEVMGLSHLE